MPTVQGSALLVSKSSEAKQASGTQPSEAPGTAMGAMGTVTAMAVAVSDVPCLGPARKGAGLPQLCGPLTWDRECLGYSCRELYCFMETVTCHWESLAMPPGRLDNDNRCLAGFSQFFCLKPLPCRMSTCEGHCSFSSHVTLSCFCPLL